MATFDYRKFLKENKSTFHSTLTEGQFSWMTQDTDKQIGSEPQNTITVYMHDNEGNTWKEDNYEGYGEFGGMDYYELLDKMNGGSGDRSQGIKLAFDDAAVAAGKVLFPALTEDPRYPKGHDFTQEAKNDPNQSWYAGEEEEDDDDNYSWEDQYGDEEELDEGKDEMSAEEKANVFVRENEDASGLAEKFAKYMSKKEGRKFTVTAGSVDEKSFDLDLDGEKYEGGSYLVKDNGDIVNVAAGNEVYGNISMLDADNDLSAMDRMYNSDAWVQAQRDMMEEAEGEVMVDAKLLASYIDEMVSLADDMDYTPDMVKSLQSLKSKLSGEMSVKDALDFVKKTIDITEDDIDAIEALGQATDYDDAVIAQARKIMGIDENKKSTKMTKKELKEMIKAAFLAEAEGDEADAEVDAADEVAPEETDVEVTTDTAVAEVDPNVEAVQDALTQAQAAAQKLGDTKLTDQIGNTITFFTRAHVVEKPGSVAEGEEIKETQNPSVLAMADTVLNALGAEMAFDELIQAMSTDEAKDNLEHIIRMHDLEPTGDMMDMDEAQDDSVKINEIEFPMWTKIKTKK